MERRTSGAPAAAALAGAVIVGPLARGARPAVTDAVAAPGFSAALVFSAAGGLASLGDAAAGDAGAAPWIPYSRVGRAICGFVASSSASSPVDGAQSPSISRVVIFRCGATRGFSAPLGRPGAFGISSASMRAGVPCCGICVIATRSALGDGTTIGALCPAAVCGSGPVPPIKVCLAARGRASAPAAAWPERPAA